MHGRSHELEFNVLTNNSLNILGENVVKYILVTITLGKDKGPSACKKQLFLFGIKASLLIAELHIMLKLTLIRKF